MTRSVDAINISNWQQTGSNVPIPQYQFDLQIIWTDDSGVRHEHNATYRYPNDLASMPLAVRREFAEQQIIATARVQLGIETWEMYG